VVDIGPGLFNTEIATRPFEEPSSIPLMREGGRRLMDLRRELGVIDRELQGLKERRTQLIAQKKVLLEEAGHLVEADFDDYGQRRVIYEYIKHPELSRRDLARGLGLRDDLVERIVGMLEGEENGS